MARNHFLLSKCQKEKIEMRRSIAVLALVVLGTAFQICAQAQTRPQGREPKEQAGWGVAVIDLGTSHYGVLEASTVAPVDPDAIDLSMFAAPIGPIKFDAHMRHVPISNNVAYRGTAIFRATEPGDYRFIGYLDLLSGKGMFGNQRAACKLTLWLENTVVFDKDFPPLFARTEADLTAAVVGQQPLEAGDYPIKYLWVCTAQSAIKSGLQLRIQVRRPGQGQPSDFRPNELFHKVGR